MSSPHERAAWDARAHAESEPERVSEGSSLTPETQTLVRRRLIELGLRTLHGLILNGSINERTRHLRPIRLSSFELAQLQNDEQLRSDIVVDSVLAGLDLFEKRTSEGRGWEDSGGASLDTYFINACLLCMANPVRAFRRNFKSSPPDHLDVWLLEGLHDPDLAISKDPGSLVAQAEGARQALERLAAVDSLAYEAVLLRLDLGLQWSAIAHRLGITEKALERRRARARKELASWLEET